MQTHQNITLSIPRQILKKAKILAIERNTSLSGLLTQTLIALVENNEAYEAANTRIHKLMEEGINMGTYGKPDWNRDDLHERTD